MSKIYVTVGLPASGKSTYCEQYKYNKDWVVLSSDEIRAELGDVNDQSKNELVFKILHQRIKDDLRAGKNVIYDATNLSRKKRVHFLNNELKGISCEKICVLFATPYEFCLANNCARDRHVPEEVLERMYKSFETPWYTEGFDDIQIVWWKYKGLPGFEYNIKDDMCRWRVISHDNIHHSLTVGSHMLAACDYIKDRTNDIRLITATLLHDCGKPSTKFYDIDDNGEIYGDAKFYGHHNVGAYLSLFYVRKMHPEWSDKDLLYVSLLINLHMKYFMDWRDSDKAREKDRLLLGDELIKSLDLLHEADLAAH